MPFLLDNFIVRSTHPRTLESSRIQFPLGLSRNARLSLISVRRVQGPKPGLGSLVNTECCKAGVINSMDVLARAGNILAGKVFSAVRCYRPTLHGFRYGLGILRRSLVTNSHSQ